MRATWALGAAFLAALTMALAACERKPAAAACSAVFAGGRWPEAHPKAGHTIAEMQLVPLCNSKYAVLYSGVTKSPLAAAEFLTADDLKLAATRPRKNTFHADERLPAEIRTTLADWKAVGLCLDRGHLVSNGDAPTDEDANETFLLSNMVAEDADNNERLWLHLERLMRAHGMKNNIHVVSGPVFKGPGVLLNNRIYIPQFLFKAFYIPATRESGVYVTRNSAGTEVARISVNRLQAWAGIDAMPGMPADLRDQVPPEPPPVRTPTRGNRELTGGCRPVVIDGGPMPNN